MPWSQDNKELKDLETNQVAAGAQLRDPDPLRDLEQLSEGEEILLCHYEKGHIFKTRVKILIGPYPVDSPSFMEVKIEGRQCQISLRRYGIIPSTNEHVFSKTHWIELLIN